MSGIGSYRLISARIMEPARGRWQADITLDTDATIAGAVVLDVEGVEYHGTVHRGASWAGRWRGRIIGGAGGWATELAPKAYVACSLDLPLRDALAETSETLAVDAESLLPYVLPHWSRLAGPASRSLDAMVAVPGWSWRTLRDGTTWLGETRGETVASGYRLLDRDELYGRITVAPDQGVPVQPGDELEGLVADRVVTVWAASGIRQEVWSA